MFYVTLSYVTFSLFTVAGPAISSFWLVVSVCTLTPKVRSRSNPRKGKQNKKVKTSFEQFLCHLQIDFK